VPHNKSTKKRVKTNEIRRQRNVARRSRLRHAIRDLRKQAEGAEAPNAELLTELRAVSRMLDRMASKGVIHPNKAARLKSRLQGSVGSA
jgi:small subunit ribosomal protein S20